MVVLMSSVSTEMILSSCCHGWYVVFKKNICNVVCLYDKSIFFMLLLLSSQEVLMSYRSVY